MSVNKVFGGTRRFPGMTKQTFALEYLNQIDKVLYVTFIYVIAVALGLDEVQLIATPDFAIQSAITGVALVALDREAAPLKYLEKQLFKGVGVNLA